MIPNGVGLQRAHVRAHDPGGRVSRRPTRKLCRRHQHGVFEIRRLVPADYRIAAWEDIDIGAVADEEFMGRFTARGTGVTAPAWRVDGVALKVVSRDEINSP